MSATKVTKIITTPKCTPNETHLKGAYIKEYKKQLKNLTNYFKQNTMFPFIVYIKKRDVKTIK